MVPTHSDSEIFKLDGGGSFGTYMNLGTNADTILIPKEVWFQGFFFSKIIVKRTEGCVTVRRCHARIDFAHFLGSFFPTDIPELNKFLTVSPRCCEYILSILWIHFTIRKTWGKRGPNCSSFCAHSTHSGGGRSGEVVGPVNREENVRYALLHGREFCKYELVWMMTNSFLNCVIN